MGPKKHPASVSHLASIPNETIVLGLITFEGHP
jgi:hypothetical protein